MTWDAWRLVRRNPCSDEVAPTFGIACLTGYANRCVGIAIQHRARRTARRGRRGGFVATCGRGGFASIRVLLPIGKRRQMNGPHDRAAEFQPTQEPFGWMAASGTNAGSAARQIEKYMPRQP